MGAKYVLMRWWTRHRHGQRVAGVIRDQIFDPVSRTRRSDQGALGWGALDLPFGITQAGLSVFIYSLIPSPHRHAPCPGIFLGLPAIFRGPMTLQRPPLPR